MSKKIDEEEKFRREIRTMMKMNLIGTDDMDIRTQEIKQKINEVNKQLKNIEKDAAIAARAKVGNQVKQAKVNKEIHQKLTKIETETDSTGKVQGIFDFSFAIVTITMAILLIPKETTRLAGIIFTIIGIAIYLILALPLYIKSLKFNIKAFTTLQIILSISALITYIVTSHGV